MKLKTYIQRVLIGSGLTASLCWQAIPAGAQQRIAHLSSETVRPVDEAVKVTVVDDCLLVSNVPENSTMEIYNIVGAKVKEIKLKHPSGEYKLSLPKGYYIVRIAETVRKIVLR